MLACVKYKTRKGNVVSLSIEDIEIVSDDLCVIDKVVRINDRVSSDRVAVKIVDMDGDDILIKGCSIRGVLNSDKCLIVYRHTIDRLISSYPPDYDVFVIRSCGGAYRFYKVVDGIPRKYAGKLKSSEMSIDKVKDLVARVS